MRMIDMHCDTLWKLIDLDGQGDLMKNEKSGNRRAAFCLFYEGG